jgi:hypothetical protein
MPALRLLTVMIGFTNGILLGLPYPQWQLKEERATQKSKRAGSRMEDKNSECRGQEIIHLLPGFEYRRGVTHP